MSNIKKNQNRKIKKIILFTHKYPFGNLEAFIDSDVSLLSHDYSLDIVPVFGGDWNDSCRILPENVNLVNLKSLKSDNLIEKLIRGLRLMRVVSFEIINELLYQYQAKCLNARTFRQLLSFYVDSLTIYDSIRRYYRNEKSDECLFYSYWTLEASYALSIYKKFDCPNAKIMSRLHGIDLYENHIGNNLIIPMRRFIYKYIDYVIPSSQDGLDYLKKKNYNCNNIIKSYLGTINNKKIPEFRKKDVCVIVSCSRVVKIKRIELILEALMKVNKQKICWYHIGDGPELNNLIEISKENTNANVSLNFLGSLEHDEIFEFYTNNQIDLFINTSSAEAISVAVMEAISFGIPAIATDVGGTRELVINGVSGYLLPRFFSTSILAKLIEEYIDLNEQEILELRRTARTHWENNFNAKVTLQQLIHTIESNIAVT